MPLADLTAISNLAMDYLGEPYLTAYETDTTVAAQAARLHLPQCIETVLEGHVWSFATRCQQLTTAPVTVTTASATLDPAGDNNAILFTAVQAGPAGNDITVEYAGTNVSGDSLITVLGNSVSVAISKAIMTISGTITPDMNVALQYAGMINGHPSWSSNGDIFPYGQGIDALVDGIYIFAESSWTITRIHNGTYNGIWISDDFPAFPNDADGWSADGIETGTPEVAASNLTAEIIVDLINNDVAASLLVTAANASGSDGTGSVAAVTATNLSGGSSTSSVYAPAYGAAFNLPSDCLRVIKLDGTDIDVPQNRWEIQGRHLLLEDAEAEAPVIHYITNNPPVDEWPTTFTDAVVFLLASRLAPKLAQDPSLAGDMLQKHEMALGKARSKDARETRSKENHGPRQLAARSGLVRARYGNPLPPY